MFKTPRIHAKPGHTIYRVLSVKNGAFLIFYALAKTLDEAVHFGRSVANFCRKEVELRPVNPLHPLRWLYLNIQPAKTRCTLLCYVDLSTPPTPKENTHEHRTNQPAFSSHV